MEGYLAEIRIFAGDTVPEGWMWCAGDILSIDEHRHLYELIGTRYGGDGQTHFNLPNMASRLPIGAGQGPGLSGFGLGNYVGVENVELNTDMMPSHTHPVQFSYSAKYAPACSEASTGATDEPVNNVYGATPAANKMYSTTANKALKTSIGSITPDMSVIFNLLLHLVTLYVFQAQYQKDRIIITNFKIIFYARKNR
jgi:microcystin-dependent protein